MTGDHFLDAEVLWPKALSKCSAQRGKATKHPWESHNSGQRAGTAVLRDGTANIGQWHHWKLSEEKPGLCHLWDLHLCIPSPQLFRQNKNNRALSDIRQTEEKPSFLSHTLSSTGFRTSLGKSLSLLLGKEETIYGRYTENKRTARN